MNEHSEDEFRDPALKQAIHRCWASEGAPAALRARIARLCQESQLAQAAGSSRSKSTRGNRISWMIWPVSLAALLLISFAVFNRLHSAGDQGAIALPVILENQLIKTHDGCCKDFDHQHLPGVSKSDDAGIARAFAVDLKQPVVMFRPADAHWVFRGASICPVGGTPSGHLVFVKGDAALSIFSLPISVLLPSMPDAHDGDHFSGTLNQHEVVGFVKDGALFCMVSSGPAGTLTLDEMKKMESRMQPSVAMGMQAKPQHRTVVLAELLQPIR
jgi:hypothetical protein